MHKVRQSGSSRILTFLACMYFRISSTKMYINKRNVQDINNTYKQAHLIIIV